MTPWRSCVLWTLVLCLFVSSCLYLRMNESSAQEALLNRAEIWQACGGGGRPPLLSPVFTQLWGSCLAHWLRHQDIQDQLREGERKKKRILTHFNTGDRWKGAAQRKLKPAVSLSGWRKKGSAALMTVERGAERKRVCGVVAGMCPNQH